MSVTEPPRAMVSASVAATPSQLLHMFQPMAMISSAEMSRSVCWLRPRLESPKVRVSPSCWVSTVALYQHHKHRKESRAVLPRSHLHPAGPNQTADLPAPEPSQGVLLPWLWMALPACTTEDGGDVNWVNAFSIGNSRPLRRREAVVVYPQASPISIRILPQIVMGAREPGVEGGASS